jgi:hypothetical protein
VHHSADQLRRHLRRHRLEPRELRRLRQGMSGRLRMRVRDVHRRLHRQTDEVRRQVRRPLEGQEQLRIVRKFVRSARLLPRWRLHRAVTQGVVLTRVERST